MSHKIQLNKKNIRLCVYYVTNIRPHIQEYDSHTAHRVCVRPHYIRLITNHGGVAITITHSSFGS